MGLKLSYMGLKLSYMSLKLSYLGLIGESELKISPRGARLNFFKTKRHSADSLAGVS